MEIYTEHSRNDFLEYLAKQLMEAARLADAKRLDSVLPARIRDAVEYLTPRPSLGTNAKERFVILCWIAGVGKYATLEEEMRNK